MVEIRGVGPGGMLPEAARRRTASGFTVSAPPADAASVAAAAPLDGMLLLQEVADAPERDRQARRHGRAMLEALAELQLGLLDGQEAGMALQRVQSLAALVALCPQAADPALQDILAQVTLRAALELARRSM